MIGGVIVAIAAVPEITEAVLSGIVAAEAVWASRKALVFN